MGWIEIVTLIIQNAPAAIKGVNEGLAWASETWEQVSTATGKDASTITQAELLAQLAHMGFASRQVQDIA